MASFSARLLHALKSQKTKKKKLFIDESSFENSYILDLFPPKVLLKQLKEKATILFEYFILSFTF